MLFPPTLQSLQALAIHASLFIVVMSYLIRCQKNDQKKYLGCRAPRNLVHWLYTCQKGKKCYKEITLTTYHQVRF